MTEYALQSKISPRKQKSVLKQPQDPSKHWHTNYTAQWERG